MRVAQHICFDIIWQRDSDFAIRSITGKRCGADVVRGHARRRSALVIANDFASQIEEAFKVDSGTITE
jgi:hypothetical protein